MAEINNGRGKKKKVFFVFGIEEGRSINKNKRVIDDGEEGEGVVMMV